MMNTNEEPSAVSSTATAASAAVLQPLIVDLAASDGVTPAGVQTLVAAGYPWAGLSMQGSHGLAMVGAWFNGMWRASSRISVGERYGKDWFRMAYHYLLVAQDARAQADVALAAVHEAGGWGDGDLWLGVDVERGEQPADATKSQVEDSVSMFAERVLQRTGRSPLLYAGGYTRDLGISSRMGCCLLWYPQWSSSLTWSTVTRMGWDMRTTLLWQCAGDGPASVPGYPTLTPIGPEDFSIMVRDNLPAAQAIEWTRTHTGGSPT